GRWRRSNSPAVDPNTLFGSLVRSRLWRRHQFPSRVLQPPITGLPLGCVALRLPAVEFTERISRRNIVNDLPPEPSPCGANQVHMPPRLRSPMCILALTPVAYSGPWFDSSSLPPLETTTCNAAGPTRRSRRG